MYLKNSHDSRDLPIPATPITETSCAFASPAEAWNSSLTSRSSRSRPTNGGSRPAERFAPPIPLDHPHRAPQLHRLGLALELVRARVLVDDRRRGRALGRLADQHRARLGHRLDPRRGVDEVAGHHPLAARADGDGGLAGEHPDARPQLAAPTSCPSAATAAASSSAARTARSASSSCATGAPHTAITASPMNFSTVPP